MPSLDYICYYYIGASNPFIIGSGGKLLIPGDYHTHSEACNHASGILEDYIQSGIAIGLPEIGISDHFPMFHLPDTFHHYAMDRSKINQYLKTSQLLKAKFASKIEVKVGFEIDYYQSTFSKYKHAIKPLLPDLDFLIGSVHVVKWKDQDFLISRAFSVPDGFNSKNGDADIFILNYYENILELVESNFLDILGHLDVVKKLGLIPEDPQPIWELLMRIIDKVEQKGMVVEINTSGLRMPEKELYPSNKIILELIERKIPLILGSDAHNPIDVGYAFPQTLQFLLKNG